jgi:hypothetical protein
MPIRDAYRTLELSYGASKEEVRQGYKDLVRVWHPDRFAQDPRLRKKAEEKLKEINVAYGELMASFSDKEGVTPGSDAPLFPTAWGRHLLGVGDSAARVSRLVYLGIRNGLTRIDWRRMVHDLFEAERKTLTANRGPMKTENVAGRAMEGEEAEGGCNDPDFRTIFDEVARQRRLRSKE